MRIGHWGEKTQKANTQLQIAMKKWTQSPRRHHVYHWRDVRPSFIWHGVGHQEHKEFQEQT